MNGKKTMKAKGARKTERHLKHGDKLGKCKQKSKHEGKKQKGHEKKKGHEKQKEHGKKKG